MPVFRPTRRVARSQFPALFGRWSVGGVGILLVVATACTSRATSSGGSDQQAIRDAAARRSGGGSSGASGAAGSSGAAATTLALFDGIGLAGWHEFTKPATAPTAWQVEDGMITRVGDGDDLVTDKTYANFELTLDWKISANGNSGIIYRIDPAAEVTYTSGPEMQVLDDVGHADGKSRLTSAGANYALYAPPTGVVKGPGEWNSVRLLVNGNHVEHWLNGTKVVEYELGSADWERRVKESKFAQWPGYGRTTRGYIGLQNHGDKVWYRNIRLRELP